MLPRHLSNRPIRFAKCETQVGEEKVQSNLALTPSQMYELVQQGKPVSAGILPDDMFDDGTPQCKTEVPIDFQRGVDVVEFWEASKSASKKFADFKKQGIKQKGVQNENG